MNEVFKKILNESVWAPSGDNCQPWSFIVKDDHVDIINKKNDRFDHPFYNFKQKGSYLSHGCLIENIIICAKASGYRSEVIYFPKDDSNDCVARIILSPGEVSSDDLYGYIRNRVTNRKPYREKSLVDDTRLEVVNTVMELEGANAVKVMLAEGRENLTRLGVALGNNETIVLETEELHKTFFSHIIWSAEEEKVIGSGLYLKTMELPPPVQLLFKGIRHWPVQRALNRLGFSRKVAQKNAKLYSTGAAIGIIAMNNNSDRDFVIAGRVFQRVWLKCTRLGVSLHPVTGILYLMLRVVENDCGFLTPDQVKMITSSYRVIQSTFGVTDKTIPMLFRLGYSERESAKSSRLNPDITYS